MTKKPKYFVVCACGEKIKITAEKICYRLYEYSSDCAVEEKVRVDRYWIICRKCKSHPSIVKIISEETKAEVKSHVQK